MINLDSLNSQLAQIKQEHKLEFKDLGNGNLIKNSESKRQAEAKARIEWLISSLGLERNAQTEQFVSKSGGQNVLKILSGLDFLNDSTPDSHADTVKSKRNLILSLGSLLKSFHQEMTKNDLSGFTLQLSEVLNGAGTKEEQYQKLVQHMKQTSATESLKSSLVVARNMKKIFAAIKEVDKQNILSPYIEKIEAGENFYDLLESEYQSFDAETTSPQSSNNGRGLLGQIAGLRNRVGELAKRGVFDTKTKEMLSSPISGSVPIEFLKYEQVASALNNANSITSSNLSPSQLEENLMLLKLLYSQEREDKAQHDVLAAKRQANPNCKNGEKIHVDKENNRIKRVNIHLDERTDAQSVAEQQRAEEIRPQIAGIEERHIAAIQELNQIQSELVNFESQGIERKANANDVIVAERFLTLLDGLVEQGHRTATVTTTKHLDPTPELLALYEEQEKLQQEEDEWDSRITEEDEKDSEAMDNVENDSQLEAYFKRMDERVEKDLEQNELFNQRSDVLLEKIAEEEAKINITLSEEEKIIQIRNFQWAKLLNNNPIALYGTDKEAWFIEQVKSRVRMLSREDGLKLIKLMGLESKIRI